MLRFSKTYLLLTLLLLVTEVFIGLYIRDRIIRPYGGDYLVVILLYCLLRSFIKCPASIAAWIVLLFSYTVEVLQYFNLVQLLKLNHSEIARIVIGSSFAWIDLLAYTLGIITVLFFEKHILQNEPNEIKKCYLYKKLLLWISH